MNIQTILLSALLLISPLSAGAETTGPDSDAKWFTSVDDAVTAAEKGNRYILVDLYADWCGWCKVLEEEVFTTPEFSEFTHEMVLLRVDVDDGGEGGTLQARFKAYSLPTTLILDADMVKVGEVKGYAPTPRFIGEVRRQLEEFGTLLDFYAKVRQGGDIELMRKLAADFHGRGDGKRAAALYEAIIGNVEKGSEAVAWLHYFAADAHRLSGDFSSAATNLRQAQTMSGPLEDPSLIEQIDMLRFYIAHDRGDCGEALASLESFLDSHPRSDFRSQARRALTAIKGGKGMECT